MKIVLCLALIAAGIYGLVLEYKRRSKEKEEIMERLLANHIIAKDALAKLLSEEKIKPEEFLDSMERLTENTIEIIVKACGTKYVAESDWLMKEYNKKSNNTNI